MIVQDIKKEKCHQSFWLGLGENWARRQLLLQGERQEYEYDVDKNYDYINIHILRDRQEIRSMVLNGNEKWLVFVDSKEFGKTLKKDILDEKKKFPDINQSDRDIVAVVTSDYEEDEEAAKEMGSIIIESDVSMELVQDLMGHSTISTSMDIYAHVSERKKEQAMEQIRIGRKAE